MGQKQKRIRQKERQDYKAEEQVIRLGIKRWDPTDSPDIPDRGGGGGGGGHQNRRPPFSGKRSEGQ